MEAALDNLARFAEVLAVARSPWARDWDEAAASRAFDWARYFQQLHLRLAGSAAAQASFRQQLGRLEQRFSRGPAHPLPQHRCPRFEELGRAEETLSRALLANPAASAAAFHRAAAWYRAEGGAAHPPAWLGRAAQAKAAARLLLQAAGRQPSASETQAQILRQRLEERTRGLEGLPEQAACEEVLRRAVGGGDAAALLALAVLLADDEGGGGGNAQALALRWLLGDGRALPAFCRALPAVTLSHVAARHPTFARRYLRFLQDWAAAMRYDASTGEWLHPESPEQQQDWRRLVQHFDALLQGPPQAKEPTERTLNSMKTMDGDFDVRGISVWTDLLLALKSVE